MLCLPDIKSKGYRIINLTNKRTGIVHPCDEVNLCSFEEESLYPEGQRYYNTLLHFFVSQIFISILVIDLCYSRLNIDKVRIRKKR